MNEMFFFILTGRPGGSGEANEETQTAESVRQHNESWKEKEQELYDVETEGQG